MENEPRLSARAITERLAEEAAASGRDNWPSQRSVHTVLASHRAAPEAERLAFQYAWWPEAFEAGLLPWEAAPVVLEARANGRRLP